jgi:hypothetical protein
MSRASIKPRAIHADMRGAFGLGKVDEARQQALGASQLEAHGPAQRDVLLDGTTQPAHGRAPGQGRARVRSASMSAEA